jgi:hypothetical protein
MRATVSRILPVTALLLIVAVPAFAQEDEEGRFSVAVGGGMVQAGGSSNPYLTANFRTRIGYRAAGEERQGTVYGFLEPEVGQWSRSDSGFHSKDTLIGVNIGGAVRLRTFEYFLAGGVGYHFLDQDLRTAAGKLSANDNQVGVNAQFGFDVRMTESLSLFGVGRFDLVEQSDDQKALHRAKGIQNEDQQTKVYLGLRLHF